MCTLAYLSLLLAVFPTILFVHAIGNHEFQESLNSRLCPQYDELHYYLKDPQQVWSSCIKESDCLVHIEKTKKLVVATLKNAADNEIQDGCMDLYRDFINVYVFGNTTNQEEQIMQVTKNWNTDPINPSTLVNTSTISQPDQFRPIANLAYLTIESIFNLSSLYEATTLKSFVEYANLKNMMKTCRQKIRQVKKEIKKINSSSTVLLSGPPASFLESVLSPITNLEKATRPSTQRKTPSKPTKNTRKLEPSEAYIKQSPRRLPRSVQNKKKELENEYETLVNQLNYLKTVIKVYEACKKELSEFSGTFYKLRSHFFSIDPSFVTRALDLAISPSDSDRQVAYYMLERYLAHKNSVDDESQFICTFADFVHEASRRYFNHDLVPFGFDSILPLLAEYYPSTCDVKAADLMLAYTSLLLNLLKNKWVSEIEMLWADSLYKFVLNTGALLSKTEDDLKRDELLELFNTFMYKVTAQFWSPSESSALQQQAYERIADTIAAQMLPGGFPIFSFYSPAGFLQADQTFRLFLCKTAANTLFKASYAFKSLTERLTAMINLRRITSLDLMVKLSGKDRMELLIWIIHDLTNIIDYPMASDSNNDIATTNQELIAFRQDLINMATELEQEQWLAMLSEWIGVLAWIRVKLNDSSSYSVSDNSRRLEKVIKRTVNFRDNMAQTIKVIQTKKHALVFPQWITIYSLMANSVDYIIEYCMTGNVKNVKTVLREEIDILTKHVLRMYMKCRRETWLTKVAKLKLLESIINRLKIAAKEYMGNYDGNVYKVESQEMASLEQAIVNMAVTPRLQQ